MERIDISYIYYSGCSNGTITAFYFVSWGWRQPDGISLPTYAKGSLQTEDELFRRLCIARFIEFLMSRLRNRMERTLSRFYGKRRRNVRI